MQKSNEKENKNMRNAVAISIVLIVISVILLAGSTFAWFTDKVASGRNKITAGNLSVDIEYAPQNAQRDETGKILESAWQKVTEDTNIFASGENTIWEPGHTELAYVRIKNKGSLALKYDFAINVYGTADGGEEKEYTNKLGNKFKLSEYLILNQKADTLSGEDRRTYWLKDDETTTDVDEELSQMGKLTTSSTESIVLGKGESTELTLVVYMPTRVGNEANQKTDVKEIEGSPEIYFAITATATQAESESDSFGTDYDKDAE